MGGTYSAKQAKRACWQPKAHIRHWHPPGVSRRQRARSRHWHSSGIRDRQPARVQHGRARCEPKAYFRRVHLRGGLWRRRLETRVRGRRPIASGLSAASHARRRPAMFSLPSAQQLAACWGQRGTAASRWRCHPVRGGGSTAAAALERELVSLPPVQRAAAGGTRGGAAAVAGSPRGGGLHRRKKG